MSTLINVILKKKIFHSQSCRPEYGIDLKFPTKIEGEVEETFARKTRNGFQTEHILTGKSNKERGNKRLEEKKEKTTTMVITIVMTTKTLITTVMTMTVDEDWDGYAYILHILNYKR